MISHASARHQIIGAIQSLSDRDYQISAWLENKVPGIFENFDSIVHTLYDDTHVSNKNINAVGVYFIDQKEVQVVQPVIDVLDRISHDTVSIFLMRNTWRYLSGRKLSQAQDAHCRY